VNLDLFLKNLAAQAEQNPLGALAVGGAIFAGLAKVVTTSINAHNSRVWAKEVSRRTMKTKLEGSKWTGR
jgi:cytochrome b